MVFREKERKDIYILLLLLIRYCIQVQFVMRECLSLQTLPRGIYTTAIPTTLLAKGVPITKVTFLVLSYIPYCLKFLVAPIVNMVKKEIFEVNIKFSQVLLQDIWKRQNLSDSYSIHCKGLIVEISLISNKACDFDNWSFLLYVCIF